MISILVCCIQLSTIGVIAGSAARMCVARAPHLAAKFCGHALLLAAILALLSLTDAPRLWTLKSRTLDEAAARPAATGIASPSEEKIAVPVSGYSWTAGQFFSQLVEFRNQNRTTDLQLADGFFLCATTVGLLCFLRSLFGLWWLRRLKTARQIPNDSPLAKELDAVRHSAGIQRSVRLCVSDALSSPCVIAFRRGTIYVPNSFENWSSDERYASLAHELAHAMRFDAQWRFLADLCLTLVCFHPLMWLLRRQLIFAQELATDRCAARMIGDVNRYRRGLSLMALRMDAQSHALQLVSFSSNDVIRRIQMLPISRPALLVWQERLSLAFVLMLLIVCSAWTAEADEPLRIASKSRSEALSKPDAAAMPSAPWEELGEQSGYAVLRPRALSQHASLQSLCTAYEKQLSAIVDPTQVGLRASNIQMVQAPIVLTLSTLPPSEQQEDQARHSLSLGGDALVMDTIAPADWKELAQKIPDGLMPDEAKVWLQAEMAKFDGQTRLRLVSTSAQNRTCTHTRQLRAAWEQVATAAAAIAITEPGKLCDALDAQMDAIELGPLCQLLDCIALGIHISEDQPEQLLRLVLVPTPAAPPAEIIAELNRRRGKMVEKLATVKGDLEQGEQAQAISGFIEQIGELEFASVKSSDGTQLIVAEMSTTLDLAVLFQR